MVILQPYACKRTSCTFNPVLWIFSVSWSTAVLEGAHTSTEPPVCFTSWYTMVAEVTVLPVPGGPWMRDKGRCKACFRAYCWKEWNSSLAVRYHAATHLVSSSKSVQQPFQFRVFNNIITLGSDATEDNDQLVEKVSFTTVTEGKELDICGSVPVRCWGLAGLGQTAVWGGGCGGRWVHPSPRVPAVGDRCRVTQRSRQQQTYGGQPAS